MGIMEKKMEITHIVILVITSINLPTAGVSFFREGIPACTERGLCCRE